MMRTKAYSNCQHLFDCFSQDGLPTLLGLINQFFSQWFLATDGAWHGRKRFKSFGCEDCITNIWPRVAACGYESRAFQPIHRINDEVKSLFDFICHARGLLGQKHTQGVIVVIPQFLWRLFQVAVSQCLNHFVEAARHLPIRTVQPTDTQSEEVKGDGKAGIQLRKNAASHLIEGLNVLRCAQGRLQ